MMGGPYHVYFISISTLSNDTAFVGADLCVRPGLMRVRPYSTHIRPVDSAGNVYPRIHGRPDGQIDGHTRGAARGQTHRSAPTMVYGTVPAMVYTTTPEMAHTSAATTAMATEKIRVNKTQPSGVAQ
jgi:hypothetical protein